MATVDDLIGCTNQFFHKHWDLLDGEPPAWLCWLDCPSGNVPNFQLSGCYALFEKDKLVYVGLGVSKGGGRYKAHGISRRLMQHVYYSSPERRLKDRWLNVSSIWTIGFTDKSNEGIDLSYLACSLENYLIRHLDGLQNAKV